MSNVPRILSDSNSDILQEIPDDDLPTLRDLYKEQWPFAMHAYYWVDNFIDWKKRKITKTRFLCPEGRWDDGTFIAIEDVEGGPCDIFVFTLEESCERLKKALSKTSRIEWTNRKKYIFFLAVHGAHQPTIEQELKIHGRQISHQDIGNMWWMPKEDTVKFEYEIPTEVYLAQLKASDVDTIDAVWPHRGPFSKAYLTKLIVHNGGFGLYLKTDESLCAWIMRNNYGGMAILQTAEDHQRKGYGRILAKHFSKYWGEKGLDMFCFIMTHNKPSMTLFEKLGFRKAHGITWTQVKNEE